MVPKKHKGQIFVYSLIPPPYRKQYVNTNKFLSSQGVIGDEGVGLHDRLKRMAGHELVIDVAKGRISDYRCGRNPINAFQQMLYITHRAVSKVLIAEMDD